jgi:membrane associated rhomboid family serine protease
MNLPTPDGSRERVGNRTAPDTDAAFNWSPVLGTPGGVPVAAKRTFGSIVKQGAKTFGTLLGAMGVVSILNAATAGALNRMFGLIPRTADGAWGIVLHPLLHANAGHLAMNAVGLLVIGGTVYLRSARDFWRVTAFGIVLGGSTTWLVGRSAVHIGASGLVFAYLGYLLTTGWFDRKLSSVALSVGATVIWGSALLGLSPLQAGISWELHLFGLLGGVLGAWWRKRFSAR